MNRFRLFVLGFLLLGFILAPFSYAARTVRYGSDSTKISAPNITPGDKYVYLQYFRGYNNEANGATIFGVDTRRGDLNPTADGCENPYQIVFEDGNRSVAAPYPGKYILSSGFRIYQNQGGDVTVTIQERVNGATVSTKSKVLTVDNWHEEDIYVNPVLLNLKRGDVIDIIISNGRCSQAYILRSGWINLVAY